MPTVRRSDPFVPQTLEDYLRLVRVRRGISRRRRKVQQGHKATLDTRLMTAAMLTYTGPADPETGDWTTGLTMSPMVKGNDWARYKTKVLATSGVVAEDIVETAANGYSFIAFNGTAAIPFMRCFDLVFLAHFPSAALFNLIKANGGPKTGIHFFNFETIGQVVPYNGWYDSINAISLSHLFVSTFPNVNGCQNVDQFEAEELGGGEGGAPCGTQTAVGGDGEGHTWLCGLSLLTGYIDDWSAEVASQVASRYPGNVLDYILVDNVLDGVYEGAATNFSELQYSDEGYREGQKAMVAATQSGLLAEGLVTKVMGNAYPVETYYSAAELPSRYGEHMLHDAGTSTNTTAEDIATLRPILANNCLKIVGHEIKSSGAVYTAGSMGFTHVDRFSRHPGGPTNATWAAIREASQGALDRTYVLAARSSGTSATSVKFPLFTNENLRWR